MTNQIRNCTKYDIPDLIEMGRKFSKKAKINFNPDTVHKTIIHLMEQGILIRTDHGAIGGLIYPFYTSGEMVAQELFWWSEDKKGRELKDEFEQLAKLKGAEKVLMIALHELNYEKVCEIYREDGYKPIETYFVKDL